MNKELKHIKTSGFKTPKDYFNTLEDSIMQSVKLDEQLDQLKDTGFKTPKSYFESIEDTVLKNVSHNQEEAKVISLFTKQQWIIVSSIAASIIFMLFILSPSNPSFDSLKIETVENYIYQENYATEDLAALFSSEELSDVELTETIYTEESLETYILNNTTIEDLITE